jgi:hypothetical protein
MANSVPVMFAALHGRGHQLAVINVDVLQAAIQYGMSVHQAG